MMTGSPPRRSNRQAPPESASQTKSHSQDLRETNKPAGAATQRLMQLKQSISFPQKPRPRRARKRTITTHGHCATRRLESRSLQISTAHGGDVSQCRPRPVLPGTTGEGAKLLLHVLSCAKSTKE